MKDNRYMRNTKGWVWEGHTKLKVICKLKMGRTPNLNSIAIVKGESFLITVCNSGKSQGGATNFQEGANAPPPP